MSKELKALNKLYKQIDEIGALAIKNSMMPTAIAKDIDDISKELKTIESALERKEKIEKEFLELLPEREENTKKLKALEIIKNKRVDVGLLIRCLNATTFRKRGRNR